VRGLKVAIKRRQQALLSFKVESCPALCVLCEILWLFLTKKTWPSGVAKRAEHPRRSLR